MSAYTVEAGIGEWRAAIIDADGFPEDVHFYADAALSAVDVIYRARVREVNKSLDMAFFDLGAGKSGCMSFRRAKQLVKGPVNGIADCLREGETLLVQGLADPSALEDKAISLSAKPRLVGRYVVLEKAKPRLFFSKDLPPRTIKALTPRLTTLAESHSIIVRTAALDIDPDHVMAEAEWLAAAFNADLKSKPTAVFSMSPLDHALMAAPDGDDPIFFGNGSLLTDAKQICASRWADLSPRLTLWAGEEDMNETFGIDEAIDEALADKIELPSGGWITIEQTTALTVVDVNVGSALQGRPAADALLTVNMEAALATLYHLRFQDIGGLIVVDFVDMSAKGSAAQLIKVIDEAVKDDHVPVRRSGLSQFGLMEISRRRKGLSLRERMQEKRKPIISVRAAALRAVNQGQKLGLSKGAGNIQITAGAAVISFLEKNDALIKALSDKCHRSVTLKTGNKLIVQLV